VFNIWLGWPSLIFDFDLFTEKTQYGETLANVSNWTNVSWFKSYIYIILYHLV